MRRFLGIFFTIVYFVVISCGITFLFRSSPTHILFDILAILCFILALIVSVGLAQFTVNKIENHYNKR